MAVKTAIILIGASGRVGREITALLSKHKKAGLYAGVDRGDEIKSIHDVEPVKNAVVIDFSAPESFREAIQWCVKTKTPFVSGTTGLNAGDFDLLARAGKKIPALWSANMSEGINLFLNLIEALGTKLNDYDLQLEEIHHIHKKDAPSGTAKILREKIEKVSGRKMPTPLSVRGGGVFGIHKLLMLSDNEIITIEHTAQNRRVFAQGAIEAAVWLMGKRAKVYSMQDVLKDKS